LDVSDRSFAGDVIGWFAKPESSSVAERERFFSWRLPIVPHGATAAL
jgi:hypothetical protein